MSSKYVLESESEAERLEKQSEMPAYDFRKELSDFDVRKGSRILDAGCGTGVVCRYLAQRFPESSIVGCDISQERLEYAVNAARKLTRVAFSKADLSNLPFDPASFDAIVCRYVLQHLAAANSRERALSQMFNVLKPGGRLHVVECDGLFVNTYPQSPLVKRVLDGLAETGPVDLMAGRKVPAMMFAAGFENVTWRIETIECRGEILDDEIEMTRRRLNAAAPFLEKGLGSADEARRFSTEVIEGLEKPGAVCFINKFIVSGVRPRVPELRVMR